MKTWRMAFRNILRAKRRSLITVLAMAFALGIMVVYSSLMDGMIRDMEKNAVMLEMGHIQTHAKGYRDSPSIYKRIKAPEDLVATLGKAGFKASYKLFASGLAARGNSSAGVLLRGVAPALEEQTTRLPHHLEQKVLIGCGMAKRLEVKLGKKLVLTTTDKNGDVISGLVRVAGIFATGVDEADKYMIILPIDYMRKLLGYGEDEATQVTVYLSDRRKAEVVSQKLSSLSASHGGVALPWSEMMPDVAGVILMDSIGNYFFQVFVFLLVGAGILNTVLMGVMERMREFGVMLAVGMSPGRLWRMIMTETFWLAVVGLLVGAVVSVPVYWFLHNYGIDTSAWLGKGQVYGGVLFDPLMKAEFYLDHVLLIFSGVFLLIIAAGIYPAFIAAKTRPVETIKKF